MNFSSDGQRVKKVKQVVTQRGQGLGRVRERKASEPVGRAVNREGGDEYDHGGRSPRLAKKSPKARVSGLPVFEVMGTIMRQTKSGVAGHEVPREGSRLAGGRGGSTSPISAIVGAAEPPAPCYPGDGVT